MVGIRFTKCVSNCQIVEKKVKNKITMIVREYKKNKK